MTEKSVSVTVDITDVVCPMTFVKVKVALEEIAEGQVFRVRLNEGEALLNVPRSLKEEGHKVLDVQQGPDGIYELLVQKGRTE